MDIIYTNHLRLRLKLRNFPEHYPREIYLNGEQSFFDVIEQKFIAIKKLKYNGKFRNIMIAYKQSKELVEIFTIHPITDAKILNRTLSGRWIKNE